MKLSVQCKELTSVLSTALKTFQAAQTTFNIAVLKALNQSLKIEVVGPAGGMEAQVEAEVESGGTAAVSAPTLLQLLKTASQDTILIYRGEGTLHLQAGRARMSLPCVPQEGLPSFSRLLEEGGRVAGEVLVPGTQLAQTTAACAGVTGTARSSSAAYEGVILLESRGNKLRVAATDGFMLICRDIPAAVTGTVRCSVPAGDLSRIAQRAKDCTVRIEVRERTAVVSFGSERYLLRVSELKYPEIDHLLTPSGEAATVLLEAPELEGVARRALALDADLVRLRIRAGGLTAEVEHEDGAMVESVPVLDVSGDEQELHFNPRHLLRTADFLGSAVLRMHVTASDAPVHFTAEGDEGAVSVVMPRKP